MSKGAWSFRSTDLVRLVEAVKAAGLIVRNVEFSTANKLIRINMGPEADEQAIESVESRTPVVL
jgi:hypothetical protein